MPLYARRGERPERPVITITGENEFTQVGYMGGGEKPTMTRKK